MGWSCVDRVLAAEVEQHLAFCGFVEVAEAELHEEAVELSFGQGERAFIFDGILGRHHEKGPWQRAGHAVGCHLPLAHRLQQRRLGARRGAVDLVGQKNVGEGRVRG
jgi:hypothetical protein